MCITCFSKYLGFVHEYSVNSAYYCPYLTTVFAFLPQKHKNKRKHHKVYFIIFKVWIFLALIITQLILFLIITQLAVSCDKYAFSQMHLKAHSDKYW